MAPYSLIHYAADFLTAAHALPGPGKPFSPVRCYLACRPIELGLKAFLCLEGVALLDLAQKPYGHDLAALLSQADQRDLRRLVRLEEVHRKAIAEAAPYYSEKVFEYPSIGEAIRGYPGKPNVDDLLAASTLLVEGLHDTCLKHG